MDLLTTMELDYPDASSLMVLDTPILKVSRPVAACSRCRNAKVKCDGKLPACTSCEKNGRAAECTSTNDQFARGKERSYVSTLETRIERLKEKVEEARARKLSVVSIHEDQWSAPPSRRQSHQVKGPPTPNTTKSMRRTEAATIDDLVSDFAILSVNATARDFFGFTTAMSYARLVLWACGKEALPTGMAQGYPQRHQASALIQHYLNNVFTLLPLFDEASFWGSVDNVFARNSAQADPHDHFSVRMVLAISSASMSEQRGDERYMEAMGHVCAALSYAEHVLHPGEISSIQALLLLTEFAMLDPHHFDSWGLIGAASRAMVDLGLHQDPPKGTIMAKGKLDLRRRVYYCVYALDRSASMVQTRAFSFSDDSAKVKVPFTKQSSSLPTSPSPRPNTSQGLWLQNAEYAHHLVSIRKIQSEWYSDLFQSGRTTWKDPYPYFWRTCDSLRKWFESLPPTTSPHMRAFFELDLLYSYVYVLSPSPRVPVVSAFAQKLIFEYCIQYADLMFRLVRDTAYSSPLTFYDAMRVYMTGRQFLDVLQHDSEWLLSGQSPPQPEVKPSAPSPPQVPVATPPPGDNIVRFNIVRSIGCIKQIIECLSRFGIRWGYMSWNQRYQSETSGLLEDLNSRLRSIDSNPRRPSMWHHNSTGSLASSNGGSLSYGSPHHMSSAQGMYHSPQQSPPVPMSTVPVQQTQHVSPPPQQYYQPPMQQASPPVSHSHAIPVAQQQAQYNQPVYDFNELPCQTQGPQLGAPAAQFANWGGYGGPGGRPDTLDEENAIPPGSNPWDYDSKG